MSKESWKLRKQFLSKSQTSFVTYLKKNWKIEPREACWHCVKKARFSQRVNRIIWIFEKCKQFLVAWLQPTLKWPLQTYKHDHPWPDRDYHIRRCLIQVEAALPNQQTLLTEELIALVPPQTVLLHLPFIHGTMCPAELISPNNGFQQSMQKKPKDIKKTTKLTSTTCTYSTNKLSISNLILF